MWYMYLRAILNSLQKSLFEVEIIIDEKDLLFPVILTSRELRTYRDYTFPSPIPWNRGYSTGKAVFIVTRETEKVLLFP